MDRKDKNKSLVVDDHEENIRLPKLVNVGHQIMMGSRTASSDAGQEWLRSVGGKARIGTFADTATFDLERQRGRRY